MKPILGKKIRGKKVVSSSGLEIGSVLDIYFGDGGKLISIIVRPERETKELKEHIDENNLITVPFENVKAIGKFVVVEFP